MNFWAKLLTLVIKGIIKLICKFEGDSLSSVPQKGPLLLVINHINFLDAPYVPYSILAGCVELPRRSGIIGL